MGKEKPISGRTGAPCIFKGDPQLSTGESSTVQATVNIFVRPIVIEINTFVLQPSRSRTTKYIVHSFNKLVNDDER